MRIIGVDTGGTFTDFVCFDRGALRTHKILSTPEDPSRAVLEGLRALGGLGDPVRHGSTVATNAFLERKGARVTLVTTKGFEDLLEIGRQERGSLYDLDWERPEPLVPRSRRIGIRGRIGHDGRVIRALDHAALRRLRVADADSVAVCFLHSYANPAHERQAGRLLPGAVLSSDVLPEYREYERLSTTVLSAYVAPVMRRYLERLGRSVPRLEVMASDGGAMDPAAAGRHAARTLLSGPAGGVIAARSLGLERGIAFDMGGTSTDVCLFEGRAPVVQEGSLGGLPLRIPHFEIHTVGAGGGSFARRDAGGALRVGPESAGARPGPICYGFGGRVPTVTDANLVLGRIDPERFLGGRMRLRAVSLPRRFAEGVIEVADAGMERALRRVSVERGRDPADFWLIAFGGAGPLHAVSLADRLGMKGVVVPPHPGLFSAWGMAQADRTVERSRTVVGPEPDFRPLEREARRELPGGRLERWVAARYEGQSHELRIPWTGARTASAFHEEHRKRYGYAREVRVEWVGAIVRATIAGPRLELQGLPRGGRTHTGPVERRALKAGDVVKGPAVVSEESATTWIPRGAAGRVERTGAIRIWR